MADFVVVPVFEFLSATDVEVPAACHEYVARFIAQVPYYEELRGMGLSGFIASKKK